MTDVFPDGKQPTEKTSRTPLRVVHINTGDAMGGAAKVGWRLAEHQQATGHDARLIVGKKQTRWSHSEAFPIDIDPKMSAQCRASGYLDYEFQGSHDLALKDPVASANLVHLHNLHGGYFNPFSLPLLSRSIPVVWTLHDMQSITGHCAHSLECERWKSGCGDCPNLDVYPAVAADVTAELWGHKKSIYGVSPLQITVPSQWLKDKIEKSILGDHPLHLIYNGVNTQLFHPMDRRGLRRQMGLSEDTIIIGGVANFGIHGNTWKGPGYTADALNALKERIPNFLFINIGGQGRSDDPQVVNIPRIDSEYDLSKMYGLMDIYLMTSIADNCPLVILEALSSGTPVVSFATGGVPELVRHEQDGFIVGYKQTAEVVEALEVLCRDRQKQTEMGRSARQRALERFDMDRIAQQYLDLYQRAIDAHPGALADLEPLSPTVFPAIVRTRRFDKALLKLTGAAPPETRNPVAPPHEPSAEAAYHALSAELDGETDPMEKMTRFVEAYPDFPQAHNDLGVSYGQQGKWEDALAHLERAVRLDPENDVFQKNMADVYFAGIGDAETALQIYKNVLSRCPDDVDALATVGWMCHALGQPTDALTFLRRALELDPDHATAREGLRMATGDADTRPPETTGAAPRLPLGQDTGSPVLVSAVVSVYNSERFLAGRLENLIQQTLYQQDRLEIIVVDSCSAEGERAIVEDFQQRYSHIHYLRTADRETVYQAWNRGIQIARGTYFVNANSDDRFAPDALERMAQTLEADRTCHGVYGDWLVTRIENDTFGSGTDKIRYGYPEFHPALLFYLQVTSHATFVRMDVFHRIGLFDGRMKVFGDREFMLRFSSAGLRIRKIDGLVGLYLANPNSLERSEKDTAQTECLPLYEAYAAPERFARLYGFRDLPDAKLLAMRYFEAGALGKGLYVRDGVPSDAAGSPMWLYQKALVQDPDCLPALNNLAILECVAGNFGSGLTHFMDAAAVCKETQTQTVKDNIARAEGKSTDPNAYHWMLPEDHGHTVIIRPDAGDTAETEPARFPSTDRRPVRVSIVIPVSGMSSVQKRCLNTIRRWTPISHEILWVPSGLSKKGQRKLRKQVQDDDHSRLLDRDPNDSAANAVSAACRHARGDYIAWLTEDTLVSEGWADALTATLDKTPDIGITGSLVPGAGHPGVTGCRYPDAPLAGIPARVNVPYLASGCLLVRRECLEAVGALDERFHTDTYRIRDFCLRARMAGYRVCLAADVAVQRNTGRRSTPENKKLAEDQRKFLGKWSGIDVESKVGKKLIVARALEKADHHVQAGRLDAALQILIEGIGVAPEDRRIYAALTAYLLDAHRYPDAMGVVKEMPAGDDDLSDSLMGYCLEGLQDFGAAAEMADRILTRTPRHSRAWNLKGILAYRNGDLPLSRQCFDTAAAGDPSDGEPFTNLGVLAWEAGDVDQALDFFERGFLLNPLSTDSTTSYHAVAIDCNQLDRACHAFETAARLYPGNRQLRFLLIDLLIRSHQDVKAMDAIEAAAAKFELDDGFLAAAQPIRERLGPMALPAKTVKTPSVSLCMIVKNEERHLARCLRNLKPLVHEMIIVDTGSTDRTRELARLFGARVIDHEWTDDFSAARNVALDHAAGDWILVMDADEVISPRDQRRFQRTLRNRSSRGKAFLFTTRNYFEQPNITGWVANDGSYPREEAGSGWMASRKVRLFPNRSQIRFEKPVHELVEYSLIRAHMPIHPHPIPVHHYGKLNTPKTLAKGHRYYAIGETKLDRDKGDVNALIELARQASELEDRHRAAELWQMVVEQEPEHPLAHLNLSNAHMFNGDFQAAREAASQAMKLQPDLKEAFLNYAASELIVGDPTVAAHTLEDLLRREPDYPPAVGLLATFYCLAGQAEQWRKTIHRLNDLGFNCAEFISHRARQLVAADKRADAILLLEASVEAGYVDKHLLSLISELYRKGKTDTAETSGEAPPMPNRCDPAGVAEQMESARACPDMAQDARV